ELIRQSVDALIRSSKGIDEAERRRRAIAAAGRFRSGGLSVSSEHDRYLAKAIQQ
ncbi:CopG family transcriptional regulator, partial [Candidatus Parcubacteria bacterium]